MRELSCWLQAWDIAFHGLQYLAPSLPTKWKSSSFAQVFRANSYSKKGTNNHGRLNHTWKRLERRTTHVNQVTLSPEEPGWDYAACPLAEGSGSPFKGGHPLSKSTMGLSFLSCRSRFATCALPWSQSGRQLLKAFEPEACTNRQTGRQAEKVHCGSRFIAE